MRDTELWLKIGDSKVIWAWDEDNNVGYLTIEYMDTNLIVPLKEAAAKHLAQWLAYWRG